VNNPFEDREHGMITRSEVYQAVRKLVADKFPDKVNRIETIVLPGMDKKDARPGYVLFK
jgi:hypothetical protein